MFAYYFLERIVHPKLFAEYLLTLKPFKIKKKKKKKKKKK